MIDSLVKLRGYIHAHGEPDSVEIPSDDWDRVFAMLGKVPWFDPELQKVIDLNLRFYDLSETREHFKFQGTRVCRAL